MNCIEEIINIPILLDLFKEAQAQGYLHQILDEMVTQSKIEFGFQGNEDGINYQDFEHWR
jgi:hypothetical protein